MRITIDTDDKGKVNIDTGDKGNDRPGLFESTTDVPVIDGGTAPIQEVERLANVTVTPEVASLSASASPQEREAQLPLNPLRAGAAAAYQDPANLRKRAVDSEAATFAAQDLSITAIDGGAAQIPGDKKSSAAPARKQQPAKGAKRDKKR